MGTCLIVVAIEQREEARLSACRTLHAAETDIIARTLEVAQVP